VLLYTDGLTEATDPDGTEFGEATLADLVKTHRNLDGSGLQRRLLDALKRFSQGRLRDDVTLGVLTVDAEPVEAFGAC
jgi:sigma-B regulation protein RsbU (phosphoserine phosphatase)